MLSETKSRQAGKKILLTILVFLYCSVAFAQAPDTLWTKTFGGSSGDGGYKVQQTTDGGYILLGGTSSFGAGNSDIWLTKTNSYGDTIWTRTFGGSDNDVGWSVIQTDDEGYIIIGTKNPYGINADVWLIKTDSFGNTLWTKTYGGNDEDSGNSIQQTSDGGYIITGMTASYGAGNGDVWLLKTDSLGDTLWTHTYGRDSYESGESVILSMDAGFIIVVYSIVSYNPDFGLIKTDSLGNIIWSKNYGGLYIAEGPFDGKQTVDGGCVIVGSTRPISAEYSDVWLIKTNSVGDTLWTRIYGGIKGDAGSSIAQTPDEGYILLGGTRSYGAGNSDFWLIRTDTHGDIIWTKTFGGSENDWGYSVQNTSDAGYILVGHTFSFGIGGDVWLIKTTPDVSDVEQNTDLLPLDFSLDQNFPNPFNPSTKISWQSPVGSWQTLKVYDVLGNEVATLVDEYKPAGHYEVEFNSSSGIQDLASGIYFYQLLVSALRSKDGRAENYIETKKMILLK